MYTFKKTLIICSIIREHTFKQYKISFAFPGNLEYRITQMQSSLNVREEEGSLVDHYL